MQSSCRERRLRCRLRLRMLVQLPGAHRPCRQMLSHTSSTCSTAWQSSWQHGRGAHVAVLACMQGVVCVAALV